MKRDIPQTHIRASRLLDQIGPEQWADSMKRQLSYRSKVLAKKCLPKKVHKLRQILFATKQCKRPKRPKQCKKMLKSNITFQNVLKKSHQKAQNRDITHFLDKTAYNYAKILHEIGFFYTNIVGPFIRFCISDVTLRRLTLPL